MGERIYHVGIGPEYGLEGFEYRLPLTVIPPEVDPQWHAWLAPYLNCSADEVTELIQCRFREVSPEFAELSRLVLERTPFAVLIYRGAPLLWCVLGEYNGHGLLYLPPELDRDLVREALRPFGLDAHELLVEFFALFGGTGGGWPWEAGEFAGYREHGTLALEPAKNSIEVGFPYKTQVEIDEIRSRYARWLGGVAVLIGDDGERWQIGPDGSICDHQDDVLGEGCANLAEMVARFVESRTDEHLFNGLYNGLSNSNETRLDIGDDSEASGEP